MLRFNAAKLWNFNISSGVRQNHSRKLRNYVHKRYLNWHGLHGLFQGHPILEEPANCAWILAVLLVISLIDNVLAEDLHKDVFIRRKDIIQHNSKETGVWVYYKDGVYDITNFVANHPGGRDKIMLAAGSDLEPFWNVYRQHFNSPLPQELLQSMRIGSLHPDDVATIQAENSKRSVDVSNPYAKDPSLSPIMKYHSRQPINAEPPGFLLTDSWITPSDLWFVRNHHPVYNAERGQYKLQVDFAADLVGKKIDPNSSGDVDASSPLLSLDLSALKQDFEPSSIVSTIQCAGNRRYLMTQLERTNGSSWDISAIANAEWRGVKLRDVLEKLGVTEESVFGKHSVEPFSKIRHVQVVSGDGMEISIPIKKALSRWGDVLLAYDMNGQELEAKHGFPIRFIVPGHVGVRNVKWVTKIRLSGEEAYGPWQRGMAYKGLSPSLKTLEGVDLESIPSLQDVPVQSAICLPAPNSKIPSDEPLTIKGYAYSGGGKGIMRVDVSIDGGKVWHTAKLGEGSEQAIDQAWAWTFWELDLPVPAYGQMQIICKATDVSYNVQPENIEGIWNLRGINNNSWHRVNVEVVEPEAGDEVE